VLKLSDGLSDIGKMVQPDVMFEATHTRPSGPTVLVVEDDDDVCEVIKLSLASAGYHVITAADGKTGLIRARQLQPDAILLEETSAIPVVMMTAFANEQDRERGTKAGAQRYIAKPLNVGALPGMVTNAIDTRPESPRPVR
jgi:DNA-binding response OmpR family regulator